MTMLPSCANGLGKVSGVEPILEEQAMTPKLSKAPGRRRMRVRRLYGMGWGGGGGVVEYVARNLLAML